MVQLASRRATYLGVMNEVDPVTSDCPAFEPGVQAVAEAIAELRRGRMVVVMDGEGGEDEGVLMLPAESATAQSVAFMVRYTSGFLCAAMTDQRADALGLPLMVAHSNNPRGTALTVSVDVKAGVTTGISAKDRAATIQALGASTTRREDLNRPGHVLASRACPGGVLSRAGRTESAVDLCVLAGFGGVGVLAQVVNSDGSAARSEQLKQFASAHSLTAVTIADIAMRAHGAGDLPEGIEGGLDAQICYNPENLTYPYGAYFCVVDIDPGTAVVKVRRFLVRDRILVRVEPSAPCDPGKRP